MPISDLIGQQLDRTVGRALARPAVDAGARTLDERSAEALGLKALGGSDAYNQALIHAEQSQHAVSPKEALGLYQDALNLSTTTKSDLGLFNALDARDAVTHDMVVPILSQADRHIQTAADARAVADQASKYSSFYRGDSADAVQVMASEHPLATPLAWLYSLGGRLKARQIDQVGADAQSKLAKLGG